MINVTVNSEPKTFAETRTVNDLVTELGYDAKYIAVAINLECIPRSEYQKVHIKQNDLIDIVAPMQGG